MPKKKPQPNKKTSSKIKQTSKPNVKKTSVSENKSLNSSSCFSIINRSFKLIFNNWKLFSVILLIYFLFDVIFVRGIGSDSSLVTLKNSFHSSSSTLISNALSASKSGTNTTGIQSFMLLLLSIILIWSIREVINKHAISARDALYKSLYPLISFSLAFILLVVEFIPLILGGYLFSITIGNNLANNLVERLFFGVVTIGFFYLSLFLITSTILSIYIVTLPDMKPMMAIRSSWRLAKQRRLDIFWKMLFIIFAIFLLNVIIMIPFVFLALAISGWTLFALSLFSVLVFHTFMYNFYREML